MTATETGGRFGKSVLLSFAFTASMAVLALANNVIISQLGGTSGRGVYALVVSMIALALPIASVGLGNSSTFVVGRGSSPSHVVGLNHLVSALLLPVAALGGVLAWAWHADGTPQLLALAFAALALPAAVYVELARGVYLGQGRVTAYHLCQTMVIVVLIGANALLLRNGETWVLYTLVLAYWAVALALLPLGLRTYCPITLPTREQARASLGYGVRSAGSTLADAGLLRLDYLIMTPWVGVASVGLYAIADQVTHLMSWGGLVAGRMMLLESASDAEGERSRSKAELATRLYVLVILAGSAVAAATMWWLIPLAFGSDFRASYVGVLLLLPASLFKGMHALLSTFLTGRGVLTPIVRAGAYGVGSDVVLVLSLAPAFGWQGVAVAKSCAYAVQLGFTIRAFGVHCGVGPNLRPTIEDLRTCGRWVRARLGKPTP